MDSHCSNNITPEFKIRNATVEDVKDIARVHVDCWCESYKDILPQIFLESLKYTDREKMWERIIPRSLKCSGTLVVEDSSGDIVGFCDYGRAREHEHGHQGEIYALYLKKKAQGRGIGRKLIEMVRQEFKANSISSFYLWVLKANQTRNFYIHMNGICQKSQVCEIGGTGQEEELFYFKA